MVKNFINDLIYASVIVVEGLAVDKNFAFGEEEYGIAFRKGSDLTAKVNAAIEELKKNGKLEEIANKYKLGEQLIK